MHTPQLKLALAAPLMSLILTALGCGAELKTGEANNASPVCQSAPVCAAPAARCSGDKVVQGNLFVNPLTCACDAGADTLTDCALQDRVCQGGMCVPSDVVTRPARAGDVVITEVFHSPIDATPEAPLTARRWFEVYNTSADRVTLTGFLVSNSAGQEVQLGELAVSPRGYAVLGTEGSLSANGDVPVDATIMGVTIAASDTLTITSDSAEEIVSLTYDDQGGWPGASGASIQFDGAQDPGSTYSAQPGQWCVATTSWRGAALGTPGKANTACDRDQPTLTLTLSEVSVDVSDPSMISASVTIEVRDEAGQPAQAQAVTSWGLTGQGLSYDHTSQAAASTHTHALPAPEGSTSNAPATLGPWLVQGESYDYQVTVTSGEVSMTSVLKTFTVPDVPTPTWTNTLSPPALETPVVQVGVAGIPEATWPSSATDAQGTYYRLEAASGRDLIVDLRGVTLTKPLHVVGDAKNVVVLGGLFDMQTPADGAVGAKDQSSASATLKNTHPRLQSNRALHIACTHTSWVEGAHFKLNGHDADAVVTRLGANQTAADGHLNRKVYLVNTRAEGIEGTLSGYQGDLLENKGEVGLDAYDSLYVENVECLTSFNGITFHDWTSALGLRAVYVRDFYFDLDPTYATDQTSALPLADRPDFVGGVSIKAAPGLGGWDVQGLSHRNMSDGTTPQAAYIDTTEPATEVYAEQDIDGVSLTPVGETTTGAVLIPGTQDTYMSVNPPGTLTQTQHAPADKVGAQYISPFDYTAYGL